MFFGFLVFHQGLVAFNAHCNVRIRVNIYVDVQCLVYKSLKVKIKELVPVLPDLKTRTRCLEVTAAEQIKQFVSLFNNFFGVTLILHLVKIPGSRSLFRTCVSVMFCFRAHSKRPANITRNLIGVADNNNVHSIGSQKQRERNASLS